VDPEAAKIVFDSSSYLTFIPLDATRYVEVTNEYVNEFNKIEQNSVLMEFVAKIFTSYSFLINSAEEEGGLFLWDPLAVGIALDEKRFCKEMITERLTIKSEPLDTKELFKDSKALGFLDDTSGILISGTNNVRYCNQPNSEAFKKDFIKTLKGKI
jgi:inosine-uridine nucleoside N-ribohydrolase